MMTFFCEKWKDYKVMGLGILMISAIGLGFSLLQGGATPEQTSFLEVEVLAQQNKEEIEDDRDISIMVDIKGAVAKEGLYELDSNARVNDLIALAGGFLPDADPKSVNLAQKLSDEAVIYVARQGEEISVVSTPLTVTQDSSQQTDTKINLNKASLADLQTITGIGAKRAQDIITFREENGGFKQLEDLKQVSGIGDKTFEKIREEITLD